MSFVEKVVGQFGLTDEAKDKLIARVAELAAVEVELETREWRMETVAREDLRRGVTLTEDFALVGASPDSSLFFFLSKGLTQTEKEQAVLNDALNEVLAVTPGEVTGFDEDDEDQAGIIQLFERQEAEDEG